MRIAVLGGTGVLGRAVADAASAAGHAVMAISRRAAPHGANVVHRVADVATGEGLAAALAGADVAIDATNAVREASAVLVDGTRRVLAAAAAAGVRHFVGISIVGIDNAPIAYYRTKVAQEKVIEQSPVPWSLLRATQFHDLIARFANGRFGVVLASRGMKIQPIDVREVATALVAAAAAAPAGRLQDVAGPEVIEFADAARACARAMRRRRLIVRAPLPGAAGAFLRGGGLCNPARAVGKVTFASWLAERALAQ
jgi:uncharacterized protein YbjT (DUF2867 family)